MRPDRREQPRLSIALASSRADAIALVQKQIGKHHTHVFSFNGRPITQVSTKAWYAALARAGITDFRWHDLRHTWASWHVQNGTPLFALQELGGWESVEMVRRYAHLAANHLAPFAEGLRGLNVSNIEISDTKKSHPAN
jgi:integrase